MQLFRPIKPSLFSFDWLEKKALKDTTAHLSSVIFYEKILLLSKTNFFGVGQNICNAKIINIIRQKFEIKNKTNVFNKLTNVNEPMSGVVHAVLNNVEHGLCLSQDRHRGNKNDI